MRFNKKWLFLLLIIPLVAYASTSIIRQNELRLGRGVAGDISIQFDEGSGANRPKIRWNDTGSRLELSNDGTTFQGLVGASGAFTQYGVVYGDGTSALQVTSAGSAGQVLARPVGGGNPAYVNEVGALKISGLTTSTASIINTDSPYTIAATLDTLFVDAASGSITINLPAASGVSGKIFKITRTDNVPANTVTIDPDSSELIDSQSTYNLRIAGDSVEISSNGTAWFILSERKTNAGEIFAWGTANCPAGALPADGVAVSRSTYARLFAVIGTTAGAGDGVTTFNVPNGDGVVLRGTGSQTFSGRSKSGPSLLAQQEDQFQSHLHANMTSVPVVASFVGQSGGAFPTITSYRDIGAPTVDGANGTPRAGAETRASAIGVKHCIWF